MCPTCPQCALQTSPCLNRAPYYVLCTTPGCCCCPCLFAAGSPLHNKRVSAGACKFEIAPALFFIFLCLYNCLGADGLLWCRGKCVYCSTNVTWCFPTRQKFKCYRHMLLVVSVVGTWTSAPSQCCSTWKPSASISRCTHSTFNRWANGCSCIDDGVLLRSRGESKLPTTRLKQNWNQFYELPIIVLSADLILHVPFGHYTMGWNLCRGSNSVITRVWTTFEVTLRTLCLYLCLCKGAHEALLTFHNNVPQHMCVSAVSFVTGGLSQVMQISLEMILRFVWSQIASLKNLRALNLSAGISAR